jgi:hypothetical protein
MKQFLKERNRETPVDDSWEKALAWTIMVVEKECGQRIDWDYPWMKFVSLLDNLKEYFDKERSEVEKSKRKR